MSLVSIVQGLTHLGKGTLTLNPYHSDRMLMTPVAVAGILTVLVSMLDANSEPQGEGFTPPCTEVDVTVILKLFIVTR